MDRKTIFGAVKAARGGAAFTTMEVAQLDDALDRLKVPRDATSAAARLGAGDPPWLVQARRHIGEREIPGPKHSKLVTAMWKLLGQPIADDETPWCGGFVGYCLKVVGQEIGKAPAWARSWANWGKPCGPELGAVAVFSRGAGGHVGFLVGVSADNRLLYILGGNQSNMVNIMPLDAARLIAMRWPAHLPVGPKAPVMTGGTVSRNEA